MNELTLTRTSLYDCHVKAGAKLVPFAGFELPVSYSGLVEEHMAVRNQCGMFDVSHMGQFMVEGPEALDLIQWITTNDASNLSPGKVQYSCMPNGKGGIVDDLLVYQLGEEQYMLVVNAANREKDWNWIDLNNRWNCSIRDESDDWSLIALQGPEAASFLQPHCDLPQVSEIPYYSFKTGTVCKQSCIVSATGYTGAGGFELYVKNDAAPVIWSALESAGVKLCGLGARDTLRLEAGFCLYGNDIDETTSPIAAGLGWITKFTKDFVDAAQLAEEKKEGTRQILRGLVVQERGIPRQGYEVLDSNNTIIGRVTSGTSSPSLGQGIALAYIDCNHAQLGNVVKIQIRKNTVLASVTRSGFLPK
ncbi:MAG: glycine cleavage system aminomethyltransferase GcvT [Flavobacteriales bacterium]